MDKIIRIGIDTSKSVFVLHGVNAAEQPVLRKKLRRRQVLDFFSNSCSRPGSGWRRAVPRIIGRANLTALGHEVVLLPPQYVKPYVQRGKNDAADADAICEAMSRPRMRFVPVKTAEQQAALMLMGVRDQLIARRTQLSNTIRGYAAEFGITAAKGLDKIEPLLARIATDARRAGARQGAVCHCLPRNMPSSSRKLRKLEAKLMAWHRHNELSRRLAEVPAIGPIGASLLAMKVPIRTRSAAVGILRPGSGLTPKDHSTAGKQRLGVITRAGDEMLRSVLVVGATAVIQQVRTKERGQPSPWLIDLIKRKPPKLAAVALANKTARIAWKLMVSGERYDRTQPRELTRECRLAVKALAPPAGPAQP